MLKKALLGLVVVIALSAVLISTRPAVYRVTRTAIIAAPPERVFPLLNDYHNWADWSPWAKLDPNMKVTYDGPAAGVGSSYSWFGDSAVGEGRMTTLESRPSEYMKIKLEFIKPFESSSISEFTLKPEGAGTNVSWDMSGRADFMTKAFTLFSSMDSMVGPDFEKGLLQMKKVAEENR
jgi:uncharacterized protein YndB with AHSA1/START domain